VKLRSSMTLFAAAGTPADGAAEARAGEAGQDVFRSVLAKHFGGEPDEATLARL